MKDCPLRRWGCGNNCAERKHEPSAEPAPPADPSVLESLSPENLARFHAADEAYRRRIAYHESGHVLAGLFYDRATEYVTVGEQPHCSYDTGDRVGELTEEALVVQCISGPVADGIANRWIECPPPDVMISFFEKVRAGTAGNCDECGVARCLVLLNPEETDDQRVARWRRYFRKTVDLFDSVVVRGRLNVLANLLREKILLTREDIDRLVDPAELRRAVQKHDRATQ